MSQTPTRRRRGRRLFATISGLVLPLALVAACGSASSTPGEPVQDLVRAVAGFQGEDWLCPACDVGSQQLIDPVFESLLSRDADSGGVLEGEGMLVESWETLEPATKWQFKLRENIPFHDDWGTLSSDDVLYSLELATSPTSKNPAAGIFRTIKAEKINEREFTFEVPTPNLGLLGQFTEMPKSLPITSRAYIEDVGEDKARSRPIGTGSFEFGNSTPGDSLKLDSVKSHWRQTPEIESMTVRVVPDETTRVELAKAGEVHITDVSNPSTLKSAVESGLEQFRVEQATLATVYLLGQYEKPTYDPATRPAWASDDAEHARLVRRALSLAIDRDEIAKQILPGFATTEGACVTAFFPAMPGYDRDCTTDAFDPEQAKKILVEAGYSDPSKLTVKVDLATRVNRPWNTDMMSAVVQYWENLGITVQTQKSEFSGIESLTVERKANFAMLYPAPKWPIAHELLGFFSRTTDRLSYTGESPTLDRLINDADHASSQEELAALSTQIYDYLHETIPAIPIAFVDTVYLLAPGISWPISQNVAWQYPYRFEYLTTSSN